MTDQKTPETQGYGAGFGPHARPVTAVTGPRDIALVPGAAVAVLDLDLPAGLRGAALEQVARRQLQDRIGLDPAEVDMRPFAPGAPKGQDSWRRVQVAGTPDVAAWRGAAGRCRAILPDYLALPAAPDIWVIAATPQGIAARLGPGDGFGASVPLALATLTQHLAGAAPKPKAIVNIDGALPGLADLARAHDIACLEALDGTPQIAGLVSLGHGELSCDLRRDPQLAQTRVAAQLRAWRWPVLLGGTAAALWAAALWIETARIETETTAIRARTQDMVRTHFVPTGPILDIRTQVSRALATAQGQSDPGTPALSPFDIFARASTVIQTGDAAPQTVRAAPGDALTLVLRVADFAAADAVTAALAATGLQVDQVESVVTDGDSGVRTQMRLRAPEDRP